MSPSATVWPIDVFFFYSFGTIIELYGTEKEDISGFDTHSVLVGFGLFMGCIGIKKNKDSH